MSFLLGCSTSVYTGKYAASAAAAKSLQSCPTLCDPRDGSPPGFPVPGILQARTLEWVAISFSSVWKWKVKVKSLSRVWLLATPWTAAYQAPPPMGFSRQEYWSGVPSPSPQESIAIYYMWGLHGSINRYLIRVKWHISGRAKLGAAVNCHLVVLEKFPYQWKWAERNSFMYMAQDNIPEIWARNCSILLPWNVQHLIYFRLRILLELTPKEKGDRTQMVCTSLHSRHPLRVFF